MLVIAIADDIYLLGPRKAVERATRHLDLLATEDNEALQLKKCAAWTECAATHAALVQRQGTATGLPNDVRIRPRTGPEGGG